MTTEELHKLIADVLEQYQRATESVRRPSSEITFLCTAAPQLATALRDALNERDEARRIAREYLCRVYSPSEIEEVGTLLPDWLVGEEQP